ncbi:hypothetical protein J8N05_42455 [Streptomyces sp. BH-SS-21]|uniref:Uncharacterized protein n=1 Tax=Streptomyces liliiviolaceus TaxID=2823109 RepID=A0A940Y825_9ACTN|nr:hypothetical protein [Streptomyces liliiviolaceus]
MTPPPSSAPPPHRILLVLIALLTGLTVAFAAALVAGVMHTEPLDVVKCAGGTFIAVTLLVLEILRALRS